MKIAILSNINLDSLVKRIGKNHDTYLAEGYGSWIQELISPRSGLFSFEPENVFIIFDGEELTKVEANLLGIKKEIQRFFSYVQKTLQKKPSVNFFLSNLDFPLKKIQTIKEIRREKQVENYWYSWQIKLNRQFDNFYIFDLKRLIEEKGREEFYSAKLWYLGGMKYTMLAEKIIEEEINYYLSAVSLKRKKCLILDLDNTLWGGVIGEDGLDGIELSDHKEGARFRDFQIGIKDLEKMGVVLAIVSKNNKDDVREAFEKHKSMVLKLNDFAIKKINWRTKSENIKEIARELNLGLDAFVLIDDSPVERSQVKNALPEIEVPEFPIDTALLSDFIRQIQRQFFPTLKVTDEDKKKTLIYQQDVRRTQAMSSTLSLDDFLKSLKMKIQFWEAKKEDVGRIAQLTQKTNQFNLTTKRYSESQINRFIQSKNYQVYVASLADRFGDNGKICVLIVKKLSKKTALIDTFLLSCRVMSRFIEDQIINYVEKSLKRENFSKIIGEYRPTQRNMPVKELFERLGYRLIDQKDGKKKYELGLNNLDQFRRKYFGEFTKK